ncbi:hypothetical protein B0I35DRAFT_27943 [Stachybotrys elegans]|uniref:Uncharacterized protein n=1 Tax=Stachybotrys elegans TaxID=80388 RepID=A0A8K0T4T3_9HYPO|nr:hypothetical protein B0I35DRAFT_27943 [Stachybotrys elegans]
MDQNLIPSDCQQSPPSRFAAPHAVQVYANRPLPALPPPSPQTPSKRQRTRSHGEDQGQLQIPSIRHSGSRAIPIPPSTPAHQTEHSLREKRFGVSLPSPFPDLPYDIGISIETSSPHAQAALRSSAHPTFGLDRTSWRTAQTLDTQIDQTDSASSWQPWTDEPPLSSHNSWSPTSRHRKDTTSWDSGAPGIWGAGALSDSHISWSENASVPLNLFNRHSYDPEVANAYHKITADLATPSSRLSRGDGNISASTRALNPTPDSATARLTGISVFLRSRKTIANLAAAARSTLQLSQEQDDDPTKTDADPPHETKQEAECATVDVAAEQSFWDSDSDDSDDETSKGVRSWLTRRRNQGHRHKARQEQVDEPTASAHQKGFHVRGWL